MNKEIPAEKDLKKVLVIGELLADIISDDNIKSLASPSTFKIYQGGSAANLCANLKWLGVDAKLVGAVGNDELGKFLINSLKEAGLSDSHLTVLPNHQTSIILVGKNTDTPDFIPYRSADNEIYAIDNQLIESAKLIHTTAFSLSKQPAREHILNAFLEANQTGKFISIDWNFSPIIWNNDDGMKIFKQICKYHPLLKISLDDVERFAGEALTTKAAMQYLDQFTTHITCLTCGKDGVWFKENGGNWNHKPALPIKQITSVTGAGDAFWSGFLYVFLQKKPVEQCIDFALLLAKTKIESAEPLYKIEPSLYIKE
ncbi:carbohydrate kinase family protein [Pedobacter mucosus]|uniref:carbohydrate kinase family protein n=1 Tax=Pedobacter mucosus TaxID=2895286 RepID=UPI001EE4969F|nr:carbohydrate kinase family protein [Pedobacter mucosus]UKT65854.1 carbohydrate kinase family protein [Pedobacter mucosus]